jgi:hypothetical protein
MYSSCVSAVGFQSWTDGNFFSIIIGFIVCLNPLKPECETYSSILCAPISKKALLCLEDFRVCPFFLLRKIVLKL